MKKISLAALFGTKPKAETTAPGAPGAAGQSEPAPVAGDSSLMATIQATLLQREEQLEDAVAQHNSAVDALAAKQKELDDLKAAHGTEVSTLKADHDKALAAVKTSVGAQASNAALEIVAGQGVPAEQLPKADAKGDAAGADPKLQALADAKDPVAYAKAVDAIFDAKK